MGMSLEIKIKERDDLKNVLSLEYSRLDICGLSDDVKDRISDRIHDIEEEIRELDEIINRGLQKKEEDNMEEKKKTLRDLLEEDGLKGSDYGILVHNGCCDLAVSPRYLEGGWGEVLNSPAIRNGVREYTIIK